MVYRYLHAWHIDLEWYSEGSAKEFLSRCPEFSADLAIALAKRVVNHNKPSPLGGKAQNYYKKAEDW